MFEDVSFSYSPDKPLISDLSLVAEPGQTVAIVGPTGAGKTTLVNLMMRFYEIDAGRITLDGVDVTSVPRRELRSRLGMVLQDTWLFGGTIRDNIAYGRPSASEDEILEAARATYVDRFVRSLPEGYDTVLEDEGSNVSAGEKQLLTIARAFLAGTRHARAACRRGAPRGLPQSARARGLLALGASDAQKPGPKRTARHLVPGRRRR
ncbi:ABC-type multidrug transport system fused ATPase/permease subunit [Arthrobacter sp. UYEF21]